MKFLLYILAYSLVWLLHLLPEWFLFRISNFFYFLMYHVVGYRKKVVVANLKMAFPDYDPSRIRSITRKFYHHFSDLILESGICHFYSESKALKRITYRNPELLNELYSTGKLVMAVTGHYGNWEYLNTLALASDYPVAAIYKPLNIKPIDRMITKNRTRFGVMVSPMEKITRKLIQHHKEKDPVMTIFLADQRPLLRNIQYWTKFMGMDTPLYLGTEKLARKLDAAVVFLKILKVKRGRYEVEIELICKNPNEMEPYEITNRHVRILENLIRDEPQYWLWSHRRWKHNIDRYNELKVEKS
jgi:KDO2-lipid IV(A) lauroyltransferase